MVHPASFTFDLRLPIDFAVCGDGLRLTLCPPGRQGQPQPLRLETVQAIAQQRPGLLRLLQDAVYEKGMAQLAEEITQQEAESLIGSEITLVTATARKGDN